MSRPRASRSAIQRASRCSVFREAARGATIAGALGGAMSIPRHWIETVEAANPVSQRVLAAGLCEAIEHEAVAARRRLLSLEALVSPLGKTDPID